MIVDTSALIAILKQEPGHEWVRDTILAASRPVIGAPTFVAAAIVVDRLWDPVKSRRLDDIVEALGIEVIPFGRAHADAARRAYGDFGKGTGHRHA